MRYLPLLFVFLLSACSETVLVKRGQSDYTSTDATELHWQHPNAGLGGERKGYAPYSHLTPVAGMNRVWITGEPGHEIRVENSEGMLIGLGHLTHGYEEAFELVRELKLDEQIFFEDIDNGMRSESMKVRRLTAPYVVSVRPWQIPIGDPQRVTLEVENLTEDTRVELYSANGRKFDCEIVSRKEGKLVVAIPYPRALVFRPGDRCKIVVRAGSSPAWSSYNVLFVE